MLYLASQSPRRRELLSRLGVEFEPLDVSVVEFRDPGEPPADYVSRVAREKAGAGLVQLAGRPDALVLGADTEVVLADEVFGKPADAEEAAAMLGRLSGVAHSVISVVWVLGAGREASKMCCSTVRFAPLSAAEIADYVATGEWSGKAGGYAIQGRAAGLIACLEGSHSGVMGLPLFETRMLLRSFGVRL